MALILITPDAPAAREENVTKRLLPAPSQTPPPVDEHKKNVSPEGNWSVTTTVCAGAGPLLVTVMV